MLVLDDAAPKLPFWLKAGVSQLYSTLKPGDGNMKLGAPPLRSYHVQGTSAVDLTQVVDVDKNAYLASRVKAMQDFGADTDHTTSHGNASLGNLTATNALVKNAGATTQDFESPIWTLTHMMMFSQDYRAKFGEFMGGLAGGEDTRAAMTRVFGRSIAQVGADLQVYQKQSGLAVATVNFKFDKPSPTVKAATKEEQDQALAEASRKAK